AEVLLERPAHAQWMEEYHRAPAVQLGPERVKIGVVQCPTSGRAAQVDPQKSKGVKAAAGFGDGGAHVGEWHTPERAVPPSAPFDGLAVEVIGVPRALNRVFDALQVWLLRPNG